MRTTTLMRLSAAWMALLGLGATFLPQELLAYGDLPPNGPGVLLVQVTGALYLGFAVLNWTARMNLIGGIYSRPVAVGNFTHFLVVALALGKALISGPRTGAFLVAAVVYGGFAAWFGVVLFTHPKADE